MRSTILATLLFTSSVLAEIQPWDLRYPKRIRAHAAHEIKLRAQKAKEAKAKNSNAKRDDNETPARSPALFYPEGQDSDLSPDGEFGILDSMDRTDPDAMFWQSGDEFGEVQREADLGEILAILDQQRSAENSASSDADEDTSRPKPTPTPTPTAAYMMTVGPTPTQPSGLKKQLQARADATCAPTYSGARTTITGTGTLPTPTAFVRRSGQQLTLEGKNYRMVGPNIYWLCKDENIPSVAKGTPPDKARVREALAIAVAMGANTIRLTSCGTSVGNPYMLEPTRGRFAEEQYWDAHDYAIFAAGRYGLRVVLPLIDNYSYYHGGKYTFLNWFGESTTNYGSAFFDPNSRHVRAAYFEYIRRVMTRKNIYSRRYYKDDPTIMAWETGNELGGYMGRETYPPYEWTNSIAQYIKSLSPKSLVIDGSDGFYNYTTREIAQGGKSSFVDMITDHAYPRNYGLIKTQIDIAKSMNKNFLIGEFDWTNNNGGDTLDSYLANLLRQPTIGALFWSVFGHDSQCCNYVSHDDGYSIYYPNGNTASDQARVLAVSQFFYRSTGRAVPRELVAVKCPQPVF